MELGNMIFGNSRGQYPVDRALQETFHEWLDIMGFDSYGNKEYSEEWVFENDVFRMQPYYWGDCECGPDPQDWVDTREHKPDCFSVTPNFTHKPSGLEIQWYKYPFRDSYSNQPLDKAKLRATLKDCARSLNVL